MCNLCDQLGAAVPDDDDRVVGDMDWYSVTSSSFWNNLTVCRGWGILTSSLEYQTTIALDEELGLRELRAKIHDHAGVDVEKDGFLNRLSINAEFCFGDGSVEIVREYLDTGVLHKYYEKNYPQGSCLEVPGLNKLIVLCACALTLGCVLPEPMVPKIEGLICPIYQAFVLMERPNAFVASPLARK